VEYIFFSLANSFADDGWMTESTQLVKSETCLGSIQVVERAVIFIFDSLGIFVGCMGVFVYFGPRASLLLYFLTDLGVYVIYRQ